MIDVAALLTEGFLPSRYLDKYPTVAIRVQATRIVHVQLRKEV